MFSRLAASLSPLYLKSPFLASTLKMEHFRVQGFRSRRWRAAVVFALKVIGVGLFAGLVLTYCNMLLDACFGGIK